MYKGGTHVSRSLYNLEGRKMNSRSSDLFCTILISIDMFQMYKNHRLYQVIFVL